LGDYTAENTQLIHHDCYRKQQVERASHEAVFHLIRKMRELSRAAALFFPVRRAASR
jgi:hypothetical protein